MDSATCYGCGYSIPSVVGLGWSASKSGKVYRTGPCNKCNLSCEKKASKKTTRTGDWCLHVIIDPWVNSMSGVWNVGFLQCYIIDHSSQPTAPEPDYCNVYSASAQSKSCHVGDVRMLLDGTRTRVIMGFYFRFYTCVINWLTRTGWTPPSLRRVFTFYKLTLNWSWCPQLAGSQLSRVTTLEICFRS